MLLHSYPDPFVTLPVSVVVYPLGLDTNGRTLWQLNGRVLTRKYNVHSIETDKTYMGMETGGISQKNGLGESYIITPFSKPRLLTHEMPILIYGFLFPPEYIAHLDI